MTAERERYERIALAKQKYDDGEPLEPFEERIINYCFNSAVCGQNIRDWPNPLIRVRKLEG